MLYKKPALNSYSADDIMETIGPCQNQYTTATFYTTTGNSSVNVDGHVWNDSPVITNWGVAVGDSDGNTIARGFMGFDISSIAGKTVASATLRVYQANIFGGTPYTDLGNVLVDHIDFGSSIESGEYSSGTLASNIGTISSNPTLEWKTLDVSSYVQADINAGKPSSQFRLRFLTGTDNDNAYDLVGFEASENLWGTGNKPELVVTYK